MGKRSTSWSSLNLKGAVCLKVGMSIVDILVSGAQLTSSGVNTIGQEWRKMCGTGFGSVSVVLWPKMSFLTIRLP